MIYPSLLDSVQGSFSMQNYAGKGNIRVLDAFGLYKMRSIPQLKYLQVNDFGHAFRVKNTYLPFDTNLPNYAIVV